MESVLAWDCSGNTGWAVLNEELTLLDYGIVKGSGKNIIDYMEEVRAIYKLKLPTLVVIEEPFINVKRPTAVIPLCGYIQTVRIATLLENKDALILSLSNKTVKKVITGNGNAKKEQVFKCIVKKYEDQLKDFDFKTHNDITDAVGLAILGIKVFKKEIVLK